MPKLRKFVYCSFLVGRHNKMLPLAGAVERSETEGGGSKNRNPIGHPQSAFVDSSRQREHNMGSSIYSS